MNKKSPGTVVSATDILDKIKSYTEFESVTISPDGSISVTFAGRSSAPKKKPDQPRKTVIDSLSETPPPFKFGE